MSSSEPRLVGRYAIYGEIAAGGMATVHLGRLIGPVGFSRTVAIKRLHEHFAKDEEFVSMFIDEARLAARVHHPNVVQTIDVVQTHDQLLLVMEYVHGAQLSLLSRLARKSGRRIPFPIVSAIVAGMLRGLHAAHEATDEYGKPIDIVHRDVSPHNVLVGVDGVARVIDFGVAKAAGRIQQSTAGQLKGKIPYMAPEQVRGELVTRKTDIFSSGIVLWEMLVGQRLFEADNDAAVISQILSAPIEPPGKLDFDVPPAFDAVVMRALERNPAKRFETARDMAQALEACGPVAPPSEVSDWVSIIAAESLQRRAALVSQVESSSAMPSVSASAARILVGAPAEPTRPIDAPPSQVSAVSVSSDTRSGGPRVGLMAGLFMLASLAGAGFLIARQLFREPVVVAPPPPQGTPVAAAMASAAPTSSASASTAPSIPVSASALPSVKPKPKPSSPKSAPTTAADCDPPYYFDAKGLKKYKSHCL